MKIKSLTDINDCVTLFEKDSNGRAIKIHTLKNVIPASKSLFYPNVLLKALDTEEYFNPVNETTMSLKDSTQTFDILETPSIKIESDPMFYFVYNTDNYFHFLYDTLPYLITYKKILASHPKAKLLMNYPNPNKKDHYAFIVETFETLGISSSDIRIIDAETKYEKVFISTSYTHDFDSNLPPRAEIYDLYKDIVKYVELDSDKLETPKKIYVSRRSWLHGNFTNIGTNYTTRRKMINEDELVNELTQKGYVEVFPENMSMKEKVLLFNNAESVIGAIGGGLCNTLFCEKTTQLVAIVSPYFLDVNKRFLNSFQTVNYDLFDDVSSVETDEFKTYMRVKSDNTIGEITKITGDDLTISFSDETLAGWNNDIAFMTKTVKKNNCIRLDNGLNSPWEINLESFKQLYL